LQDIASLAYNLDELIFIAWARHIRTSLTINNFSFICGFEGRHRSGKSESATALAYLIDPTFWPRMEHRIVKTPQELMVEIETIAKEKTKGAVIIIDEGGVVVPSDEYFQEWYKTLSRVFQMFGYLNPCIFFCAVVRDNIGAKFRKLFHAIVMVSRNSNAYTYLNIYNLKYNPMFAKYMHSRPKLKIGGQEIVVRRIKFGLAPEFIRERYKNLSLLQKSELLEGFGKKINEKPKAKVEINFEELVAHVAKDFKLYESKRSKPSEPVLSGSDIRVKFHLSARDADFIKRHAEIRIKEAIANGAGKPNEAAVVRAPTSPQN